MKDRHYIVRSKKNKGLEFTSKYVLARSLGCDYHDVARIIDTEQEIFSKVLGENVTIMMTEDCQNGVSEESDTQRIVAFFPDGHRKTFKNKKACCDFLNLDRQAFEAKFETGMTMHGMWFDYEDERAMEAKR